MPLLAAAEIDYPAVITVLAGVAGLLGIAALALAVINGWRRMTAPPRRTRRPPQERYVTKAELDSLENRMTGALGGIESRMTQALQKQDEYVRAKFHDLASNVQIGWNKTDRLGMMLARIDGRLGGAVPMAEGGGDSDIIARKQ